MSRALLPAMLNALLAVLFAGGVYVDQSTHDAPEGHYNGHLGTLPPGHAKPDNIPTWQDVKPADRRGCRPVPLGKAPMPYALLLVNERGQVGRLVIGRPFPEGDVWVVGVCDREV